ncbi:retrotransposon gag domain, Retroviral aspartyl protease [Artemisia annua]|uniref:Retrotransposon gag domain, Retroviral aspartyl protease n=1 Tax=Artemisia annua TaxID=35608 RepID=A0A2U1MTY6_ARTAN|nr:retrotransposon gag domain, Retroviral aspartyl protease [Artemisia annua]
MAWAEVFNAAIDVGWLERVKCGRKDEEVYVYVASSKGFDLEAARNFRASYDQMFLRQFPYIEKVATSFRLPLADIMNIFPAGEEVTPGAGASGTAPSDQDHPEEIESMVQTWSNSDEGNQPPDPVATQLAAIAKKLESIDALQKDVAALKSQSHNRDRSGYGNERQDEGESSWHNQRYRPHNKIAFPTFSEGDPRGVFLNGLKEELKADVRIQKSRTVYKASIYHLWKTPPQNHEGSRMLHSTEVIILIDPGSTHNFISDVLAKDLKLNTQTAAPFGVQIGNGDFIRCSHICKNLTLQVNELKIVQDFFPFSIGGTDLVLGIQWLETLNTVQANWKEMFMIFNVDGKRYKWQGISMGSQVSSCFQHLVVEP